MYSTHNTKTKQATHFHFLPTGCSDAIAIAFQDDTGQSRHLIIDGGYQKTYRSRLKKYLWDVRQRGEHISLWVITHTDSDHIGGVIEYLRDKEFRHETDLVRQFWFNWSTLELPPEEGEIGVRQGMELRDYLIRIGKHDGKDIDTTIPETDFHGARITILSPSPEKLEVSKTRWMRAEKTMIGGGSDYHFTIETLLELPFQEDTSVWNGGSLAFLLEVHSKRVLFLGDSHPSTVTAALQGPPFFCSWEKPLQVDLVKVSHHGSSGNTSSELLELIDCRDFVFCANGVNAHGFPHKQCLARILDSRKSKPGGARLMFNHPTPTFEEVFKVDEQVRERYNFEIVHLEQGALSL